MKGLDNHGNTCYLNSCLQAMLQVPPLSNYLISKGYSGECELTAAYEELVKSMWVSKNPDVKNFLGKFRTRFSDFNNCKPHDAQEAFLCILDVLDSSLPVVKDIFNTEVIQETVYPGGRTKKKDEFTVNFLFPKPSHENILDSIKDVQQWNGLEDYEDDDGVTWKASATRTLFWKLPRVMVFSLGYKMPVTLVDKFIPEVHPDSPHKEKETYELFASCVHNSGHYVAFTRHRGDWYLKNDGFVTKMDIPMKAHHYLFFYKRLLT